MKRLRGVRILLTLAVFLAAPLVVGQKAWAYPYHYIYPGETLTMENTDLEGGLYITKSWRAHNNLISIEPLGIKQTRCRVTGVRAGGRADVTCTTKATALDGYTQNTVTHTYEFVVVDELEGIRFNSSSQEVDPKEKICMEPNQEMDITIAAMPSTSYIRNIRVTSTDPDVLDVSYHSSTGTATLTAKDYGLAALKVEGNYLDESSKYKKNYNVYVVVAPALENITLRKTALNVDISNRDHFWYGEDLVRVSPSPSTAPLGTVTFTSSDTSVVEIVESETKNEFNSYNEQWSDSAYCRIYPLKTGTATITATTDSGLSAVCTVTVTAPEPSSITISSGDLELYPGDVRQLSAAIAPVGAEPNTVIWIPSNPDVLQIDADGKLTVLALSDFYEYIIARTENGKEDMIYVSVMPKIPETVFLNKTQLDLGIGDTYDLELTVGPEQKDYYYCYWESSNPDIVSVEDGRLCALKEGTATITVEVSWEKKVSCTVTVGKTGNGTEQGTPPEQESPEEQGPPIEQVPPPEQESPAVPGSPTEQKPAVPGSPTEQKPAVPGSPTEQKPAIPEKKGTVLKNTSSNGIYKVTASGSSPSVAYTKPSSAKKSSVVIPDTIEVNGVTYQVTSIEANAFKGNTSITKVTIGKNITSIGAKAFYGCKKLKTVSIGSKVKTVGNMAFYKCTALTKVTIPSKVNKIGKQAFYGCKKLKTITIKSTKLTSKNVGASAFKGTYSKAKIKVPKGKAKSYKKILQAKGLSKSASVK